MSSNYKKIEMDYNDFVDLVAENSHAGVAIYYSHDVAFAELSEALLEPKNTELLPTFYLFEDLSGSDYVLAAPDNKNHCIIFKAESAEGNDTCEDVLRQNLALWSEDDRLTLAAYRLKPLSNKPSNDILIWCEYNFVNHGANTPTDDYVRDATGKEMSFKSKKKAVEYISMLNLAPYQLAQDEVSRPSYSLMRTVPEPQG